ncbi:hypothetical protein CPB86DRAFT_764797 [Serendipita vermifera]|nr:hypothetical protein CPB86DRAFT_764797 [Serendipita vermifera]
MSINIVFSNNSVRNTTASCESLGIHYDVSKEYGIISVHRWESGNHRKVAVGDIQYLFFRRDRIHLGGESEWKVMGEFLRRSRNPFSSARTFIGNNGQQYRWATRFGQLYMFEVNGSSKPLIKYHRNLFQPSYLEILDSSVMSSIDKIFLSFLIAEKKRRDRQKRRHRAGGGGPGGDGGGGGGD